MTLAIDGTASAQINSPHAGVAWLIELAFTTGVIRLTTWPVSVQIGAYTYVGLGTFIGVGGMRESADVTADKVKLTLAAANTAILAATVGDPAVYRGREVKLSLQLFSDTYVPSGAAVLRWRGYMDKVGTSVNVSDGDGLAGQIQMECSKAGMSRARNQAGMRMTDAQQQATYPGDTGLRYVRALIQAPQLWLSKRFQQV